MISISACPARVWATTAVAGIVAGIDVDTDASGEALLRFDIPSQSLPSALESYGAFADVSLLYDSSLTAGRVSTPVQGDMSARAALSRLLDGSGLVARYTGPKSVTLVAGRTNSPDTDGDAAFDPAAARRYFGLIQTRVHDAFCAQPLLAQGARRVAFRLWVGTSGVIGPVALLGSSGDPATDAAVVSALQGASVGEPAPPALAQPFTFVVQPRASGRNWGCDSDTATDVPRPGRSHGR
ncbi:Ferripyoverdine receptor [Pandoraea iniqua]|uniref:secretin and TonB N-terminal domain-containing protein n=1 Tax=Pandoraea iniqua TaxID=2508288 RepID=UPI0012553EB4|nr:secretin and TonB N-terminal domain-containing protein [Pandoraea iniqua]VVE17708.1 Ferripyoverdine receptor [Pandoraea iniqua]